MASMLQTGPAGSMTGSVNAFGTLHSAVSLAGTSSAGDQLVFHLATTVAQSASGSGAGLFATRSTYTLNLLGFANSVVVVSHVYDPGNGPPVVSGNGYAFTGGGIDLTVGFGGYTGSTSYSSRPWPKRLSARPDGRTRRRTATTRSALRASTGWTETAT